MNTKYYRYEIAKYGSYNDFSDYTISQIKLELRVFDVQKETPKGYWIGYGPNKDGFSMWISKTSKKKYAYPTKEDALENYISRTTARIKILSKQIDDCRAGLSKAEVLKELKK